MIFLLLLLNELNELLRVYMYLGRVVIDFRVFIAIFILKDVRRL